MKTSWVNEAICLVFASSLIRLSVCAASPRLIMPIPLHYADGVTGERESITGGLVRAQCRSISGAFLQGCECSEATRPHNAEVTRKFQTRIREDEVISSALDGRLRSNAADEASFEVPLASVALKLLCSCHGDQPLELGGISSLPQSVEEIVVSDCRGGTVTLSSSLSSIGDSHLKLLQITNVKNLTLRRGALDLNLLGRDVDDVFQMRVENVGTMNVERGAIRLSGKRSSIEWKNVVLSELPSFSISAANLSLLELNGVLVSGPIETAAINLESSGTSLVLEKVDARRPVNQRWISGDAREFKLTDCRLNLAPGAFQQISFSTSNPNIVIRNNVFGDARWPSRIFPSLASRVFDFSFVDGSAVFNFTKNKAQCSAGNLEFLTEHKKSSILHWLRCGLLKTLTCLELHLSPIFHSCHFDKLNYPNIQSTMKSLPVGPVVEDNAIFPGASGYEQADVFQSNKMVEGTSIPPELLSVPSITAPKAHGVHLYANKTNDVFSPVPPRPFTDARKARYQRDAENILRSRNYRSVSEAAAITTRLPGLIGQGNTSNTLLDEDQWVNGVTTAMNNNSTGNGSSTGPQDNKSHALQINQTCNIMFSMCIFISVLALNMKSW